MRNDSDTIRQKASGENVVISGRVRRWVGESVFRILKKAGMSNNEFIKLVCDVVMRYMSPDHNMTDEICMAMGIFENMQGWKSAVKLSDSRTELHVSSAIYFMAAAGKKGFIPVMVDKPFLGEWKQRENVVHIYEAFLEMALPGRYRRLRDLAVELGCNSQVEMLDRLIDIHCKEEDNDYLRQLFEDCSRAEEPAGDVLPYKRHPRKGVESIPGVIRFDDEDRKRASEEAWRAEEDDFFSLPRPIGYED